MPQEDVVRQMDRERSVTDRPGKVAPIPVPPSMHEFSKASYSMTAPKKVEPKLESGLRQEAESAGAGVRARLDMEAKARKALE